MKKSQIGKIGTIAGIAAIGAVIAYMAFLQIQLSQENDYKREFEAIVIDVNSLTREYVMQESRWIMQDNATLVQVIDQYLPRYQGLVDRAEALAAPESCQASKDLLAKAIDSEMKSNEHFRNFLVTGDRNEEVASSRLLTDSLNSSAEADAAINSC